MKTTLLIVALITIAVTLALVKCGEGQEWASAETVAARPTLEITP